MTEREREERETLVIQPNLPLTSQSGQSRWCRGSLPSLSAARDHHLPVPAIPYIHTYYILLGTRPTNHSGI